MQLFLTIHDSWAAHAPALAEILGRVRQLEQPAPTLSPPPAPRPRTVEPRDDDEDLAELVAGMDTPEVDPAATSKPSPPTGRLATPIYDGVPRSGVSLYKWACTRKALPQVNAAGKRLGHDRLVSKWSESQVAAVYRELTASTPAANGRPH